MRLAGGDLVREQLTDDHRQRGAAVGEGNIQPADVAEPAQYGFSVTGDRLGTDAIGLRTERRRVGEHV